MTAPERDLLDVLAQVVGPDQLATVQSWPRTYDPAANLDEDTLRRSRLSMAAARAQRRPPVIKVDEYGRGSDGRYYPSRDGAA